MIPLITGAIGLSLAVLIAALIRKDKLHVTHGIGWIIIATGFSVLGLAPGFFDQIATKFFGIAYPPVLALTLGIALLVIKILLMDIERSRSELRNQRLIQRMAMLEADLEKLREASEERSENSK